MHAVLLHSNGAWIIIIIIIINTVAVSFNALLSYTKHAQQNVTPYVTFTSCEPSDDDLCCDPTTPSNNSDCISASWSPCTVNCNSYKTKNHPRTPKCQHMAVNPHVSVLQDRQRGIYICTAFQRKLIRFTLPNLITIGILKLRSFLFTACHIQRQHFYSLLANGRPGDTRQAMYV